MFSADYAAEFWGVLALYFDQLSQFIIYYKRVSSRLQADPLSIIARLELLDKEKTVDNEAEVMQAMSELVKSLADDKHPEGDQYLILNKVYSKLHKALFDIKNNRIGVSFPEYKIKLGKLIRIYADQAILNDLQDLNCLGSLSGYCKIKVPEKCKHRVISM
jgi:hypothetical protein